jgi:hypothetical protein
MRRVFPLVRQATCGERNKNVGWWARTREKPLLYGATDPDRPHRLRLRKTYLKCSVHSKGSALRCGSKQSFIREDNRTGGDESVRPGEIMQDGFLPGASGGGRSQHEDRLPRRAAELSALVSDDATLGTGAVIAAGEGVEDGCGSRDCRRRSAGSARKPFPRYSLLRHSWRRKAFRPRPAISVRLEACRRYR